jgi:hypothetical protein
MVCPCQARDRDHASNERRGGEAHDGGGKRKYLNSRAMLLEQIQLCMGNVAVERYDNKRGAVRAVVQSRLGAHIRCDSPKLHLGRLVDREGDGLRLSEAESR